MITIEQLRRKNWRVRVMHNREKEYITRASGTEERLNAKGGSTVIEITPPGSDTLFRGEAKVNPKDNFNRKLGIKIALGRCLKVAGINKQQ